MKPKHQIAPEKVREALRYEPDTGLFYWKQRKQRRPKSYEVAGNINKHGYRIIGIDKVYFTASRLAWAHYYGVWPVGYIDHINQDRSDNRIANLREATPRQNSANSRRRNGKSGFKGVYRNNKKWSAHIGCDGKLYYLGSFTTAAEAHDAYKAKAVELFGEFANAGNVGFPSLEPGQTDTL